MAPPQPACTSRSPDELASLERLGKRATRLQVQDLLDAFSREDVVAAADALIEAEFTKERTQPLEGDVRVGRAAQDLEEKLLASAPAGNLHRHVRMRTGTPPGRPDAPVTVSEPYSAARGMARTTTGGGREANDRGVSGAEPAP